MVGLMQIMIYLLGVYLVFKGFEIFQIALVSPKENPSRPAGIAIGVIGIIIAMGAALFFVMMADDMARSIGDRMNSVPKF